jgi:DNA mismatch endonuclease (patch repair protein)
MVRQARTGTHPEIALRRVLHAQGLRYLVDAPLPLVAVRRKADLLFRGAKIAVFVDGCWWHRCPQHGTQPRANAEWWFKKLGANVARDRDTDRRLAEVGWRVVRVWEHEDPCVAAQRVLAAIGAVNCSAPDPGKLAGGL